MSGLTERLTNGQTKWRTYRKADIGTDRFFIRAREQRDGRAATQTQATRHVAHSSIRSLKLAAVLKDPNRSTHEKWTGSKAIQSPWKPIGLHIHIYSPWNKTAYIDRQWDVDRQEGIHPDLSSVYSSVRMSVWSSDVKVGLDQNRYTWWKFLLHRHQALDHTLLYLDEWPDPIFEAHRIKIGS